MTAMKVTENLWIGSHPPVDPELGKVFDVLVLAAKEYQPEAKHFGGLKIVRAPIDDDHTKMPSSDKLRALQAAKAVSQALEDKKKVLITCWEGKNRSGLIAGLALILGNKMTESEAVARIRHARGHDALSNPHFRHLLLQAEASRKAS